MAVVCCMTRNYATKEAAIKAWAKLTSWEPCYDWTPPSRERRDGKMLVRGEQGMRRRIVPSDEHTLSVAIKTLSSYGNHARLVLALTEMLLERITESQPEPAKGSDAGEEGG